MKLSGGFLIALGIFIVLLMVVIPQPEVWQIGKTVMFAVATISLLFSGIYNLSYRRTISMDTNTKDVVNLRSIGILFLISALGAGMLFILSVVHAI